MINLIYNESIVNLVNAYSFILFNYTNLLSTIMQQKTAAKLIHE